MRTYSSHAHYFTKAFGDLDVIGAQMSDRLEAAGISYDTMIGTGLSGTLVVPTLARVMGKDWAIIRKEHSPHTSNLIEGDIGERWLFVDDFVSSGATLRRVCEVMMRYVPASRYVGTYMYERGQYGPFDHQLPVGLAHAWFPTAP